MKRNSGFFLIAVLFMVALLIIFNVNPARADTYICTGGTETESGGYAIHTFTSSGTFECPTEMNVEVLVVGGGGGGEGHSVGYGGGGGGAGGIKYNSLLAIDSGEISVTIGSGGATGNDGGSSIFDILTATGGKSGVSGYHSNGGQQGADSSNNGGIGQNHVYGEAGGGGGGAGAIGSNGVGGSHGGNGGIGVAYSISGSSIYYGGGGGGGGARDSNAGAGGQGGGGRGNGKDGAAVAGTANTGGGGGGSGNAGPGAAGGSGIVIIRYLLPPTPTPTNTDTPTITDTPIFTNTPTDTPTLTNMPILTFTPTITFTPSNTSTPTDTFTPTITTLPSNTPTPTRTSTITTTPTPTLPGGITWAASTVSLSDALKIAIASVLFATPPDGSDGNIYAVLDASTPGDGHWLISLANLSGIDPPYTDWNVMDDSPWMGSVDCSGTEPDWSCEYYAPEPPAAFRGANEGNELIFPWQPGTKAVYGGAGVHETDCGSCLLHGSSAVDFFGADTYGAGFMPPDAYAAASGTIIAVCPGIYNMGIKVHGENGDLVYFHLLPNPELVDGVYFQQGQVIGPLAQGNFTEPNGCGHATQASTQYHIHFTFIPTDGYFVIGGCTLDIASQGFICGTNTIHPLGTLINGSENPTGPTGPNSPGPALGGEHIWNGIITAFLSFFDTLAKNILPTHSSWGLYEEIDRIWTILLDFAWLIAASGLIWIVPSAICYGIMITIELVRWIYIGYRYVIGLEPIP